MNDEMTTGQAAKILGVSRRTVTRLVHAGTLTPSRKLGGDQGWYLLRRADVEALAGTVGRGT